jgi:hypothetical protein
MTGRPWYSPGIPPWVPRRRDSLLAALAVLAYFVSRWPPR